MPLKRRVHFSSSPYPVHINNLPYRILRQVFHYLPLRDLVQIGLVCRKWESLRWSAFCRRRSLTILVGKEPLELIAESRFAIPHLEEVVDSNGAQLYPRQSGSEWCQLKSRCLNRRMVYFLADAFPNVRTLEVSLKEISSSAIDHLIYLLDNWFFR